GQHAGEGLHVVVAVEPRQAAVQHLTEKFAAADRVGHGQGRGVPHKCGPCWAGGRVPPSGPVRVGEPGTGNPLGSTSPWPAGSHRRPSGTHSVRPSTVSDSKGTAHWSATSTKPSSAWTSRPSPLASTPSPLAMNR